MKAVKCTVVGDPGVGKSALLRTFITGNFPESFEPIIFDTFLTTMTVDGKDYQLSLWYTNGMEEFNRFRPLSYPGTNVVLICFSLESRSSLQNVIDQWEPEIRQHCPGIPVLVVGLKQDLRQSQTHILNYTTKTGSNYTRPSLDQEGPSKFPPLDLISPAEGAQLASKIGAVKYIEASSLTKQNLNTVFQETVRHTASTPKIDDYDDTSVKKSFKACKGCSIA